MNAPARQLRRRSQDLLRVASALYGVSSVVREASKVQKTIRFHAPVYHEPREPTPPRQVGRNSAESAEGATTANAASPALSGAGRKRPTSSADCSTFPNPVRPTPCSDDGRLETPPLTGLFRSGLLRPRERSRPFKRGVGQREASTSRSLPGAVFGGRGSRPEVRRLLAINTGSTSEDRPQPGSTAISRQVFFHRLKRFRAIATRYEKRAATSRSCSSLAGGHESIWDGPSLPLVCPSSSYAARVNANDNAPPLPAPAQFCQLLAQFVSDYGHAMETKADDDDSEFSLGLWAQRFSSVSSAVARA
jgi:hypothetical protein